MCMSTVVLGNGCFWCTESVFKTIEGVEDTTVGYAGGNTSSPTYEEVCRGTTGHAEVVRVEYDSSLVTFEELLDVFFDTHNPETKNREGPDIGTQYRSIILYTDTEQKQIAEQKIQELEDSRKYNTIVTEVEELEKFNVAEEKHQDFFEKNPNNAYCTMHIPSKIDKIESSHSDIVSE